MKTKTNNDHLSLKVKLRLETLSLIDKDTVNVLEAYAGDGIIWNEVKKNTDKKINLLQIEQQESKLKIYLRGDNLKYLPQLDLSKFDIIDLDAYGVPYHQLEIIFKKQFKGIVIVTYIQSGLGGYPYQMLEKLGYKKEMVKKCKTLFSRNSLEKMQSYLKINGVNQIKGYFINRKNYFYFNLCN